LLPMVTGKRIPKMVRRKKRVDASRQKILFPQSVAASKFIATQGLLKRLAGEGWHEIIIGVLIAKIAASLFRSDLVRCGEDTYYPPSILGLVR